MKHLENNTTHVRRFENEDEGNGCFTNILILVLVFAFVIGAWLALGSAVAANAGF